MKQIIFLILCLFLIFSCGVQRKTIIKMQRMVPVTQISESLDADSTKTTIRTITWQKDSLLVMASSESPLGLGYTPTLTEMALYDATNANAEVSRSIARAIDKDPNNIQIFKYIPNPNNPRDHRTIMHYKGMPYYFTNNGRSVRYGPPGRRKTISRREFEIFKNKREPLPIW